jgi:hypothetical protein
MENAQPAGIWFDILLWGIIGIWFVILFFFLFRKDFFFGLLEKLKKWDDYDDSQWNAGDPPADKQAKQESETPSQD